MLSKFLNRFAWVTFLGLFWSIVSPAQEFYDGKTLQPHSDAKYDFESFAANLPKGSILVIGEQHNLGPIKQGQMNILKALRKQGHNINVAMEYLKYPDQALVDDYRAGKISAEKFKELAWGEANFEMYQEQILFPNQNEKTWAINSPKDITIAVKNKGLANLTESEKKQLPPDFQVGQQSYRERFEEKMSWHVKGPEAMNRYFEAQSVWDDTMAWKVCEAAKSSTNTLVVIVGQFHVEYGDSLVARIQARCQVPRQKISTVFQYLFFNDEEIDFTNLVPSLKYGPVADFIMAVKEQ